MVSNETFLTPSFGHLFLRFFQLNDIIGRASGTVMQMYFLGKLLLQEKSLLVVGPTGPGEAALTNSFLSTVTS